MSAANRADILATKFGRRARVDNLHFRVFQFAHDFGGTDHQLRAQLDFQRDRRGFGRFGRNWLARRFPIVDAAVINLRIGGTEVIQRCQAEIDERVSLQSVHDDFL